MSRRSRTLPMIHLKQLDCWKEATSLAVEIYGSSAESVGKLTHPVPNSEKMAAPPDHQHRGERDAVEDYPESRPKASGFCVRGRPAGRGAQRAGHRGGDSPPGAPPTDVFGVRPARARLRHPGPRRFEFVPLWGIPVFFLYAMRRVACRTCGVRVEAVPGLRASIS
ncbi:MAG: hypothetical protein C4293_12180 [Nitrospiraceae bacterium]